ncbi:MAG: thiamine ABC transporter substrate-binding protein [Deltaproteobacteria bacterium]|nr:thiamine ABC transporter substrate-binding protein [Deltaproteobacteria bacterium]
MSRRPLFLFFSLFALILSLVSCTRGKKSEVPELVIYTYSSFTSEWGLQPKVIPPFEKECHCKVRVVGTEDTGAMLNRLLLEGEKTKADVVIGIDNSLAHKALDGNLLLAYQPAGLSNVPEELLFDKSFRLIPFDYSYYAIIYDSEKLPNPPRSLRELANPLYRRKIILEDPRTSTPGLGFLLWSVGVFGEKYLEFWHSLKPNILTISPGWDMAYGMFTKGEAPMVLSYITSPAYHRIHEKSERYKAALFSEGHYLQIEGAGIVASTDQLELARKFIDYLLSVSFQQYVPLHNYMFPVNRKTPLPEAFTKLPMPKKTILLPPEQVRQSLDRWFQEWRAALQ